MKPILQTVFVILIFLVGCKSSENSELRSAKVFYVSNNGLETITLRSIDYGNNKEKAVENAQRLAFKNLFFRGVPNSPYKDPLLGINESRQYEEHRKYLNEFYKERMHTFINKSSESISREKQGTKAVVSLTINMRALKKDLQEKDLMPKFGL